MTERRTMRENRYSHDRGRDEEAIRALEAAYDAAWHDQNVEALVACLADEAVLVNPRGQRVRGRTEIGRMFRELFTGPARGSKHTSIVTSVEFITEDVAIVDGEAVLEDLSSTDGFAGPVLTHRFADVVVRRDGTWIIAHVRASSGSAGALSGTEPGGEAA